MNQTNKKVDDKSSGQPLGNPTELLPYLISLWPQKSRTQIKNLLTNKQITINGKTVTQHNTIVKPGDKVAIGAKQNQISIQDSELFSIIYEDDALIVINKQAGVLTIATEGEKTRTAYSALSRYVKQQNPSNKIFIVHRLDRDTSGLLVFAKKPEIQKALQENWNEVIIRRTYIAIAEGVVKESEGQIRSWLHENRSMTLYSSQNPDGGKLAITNFKVIRRSIMYTMLEVDLLTGRKNQIRVHLKDLGHSIAGDRKYGAKTNPMGRMGLHASHLEFIHPKTRKHLKFKTPSPKKFLFLFCDSKH